MLEIHLESGSMFQPAMLDYRSVNVPNNSTVFVIIMYVKLEDQKYGQMKHTSSTLTSVKNQRYVSSNGNKSLT